MAETLGNLARVEGFRANLEWNGTQLVSLADSSKFSALVEDADAVDPDMPLGIDPREYVCIHGLRSDLPNLASQDRVSSGAEKYKIVKRIDNPANPFVKFYAIKVTSKDT